LNVSTATIKIAPHEIRWCLVYFTVQYCAHQKSYYYNFVKTPYPLWAQKNYRSWWYEHFLISFTHTIWWEWLQQL